MLAWRGRGASRGGRVLLPRAHVTLIRDRARRCCWWVQQTPPKSFTNDSCESERSENRASIALASSRRKGMPNKPGPKAVTEMSHESAGSLLRELVAHLRQNRTQLREEWASRITEAQLLTAM